VGESEGTAVGESEGLFVEEEGLDVGPSVGIAVGPSVGLPVCPASASVSVPLSSAAADDFTPLFSSPEKTTTQDTTTAIDTATLTAASIHRDVRDHFPVDAEAASKASWSSLSFRMSASEADSLLLFLESALVCPFRRRRTAMNVVECDNGGCRLGQ
jgi:hypothetical protein